MSETINLGEFHEKYGDQAPDLLLEMAFQALEEDERQAELERLRREPWRPCLSFPGQ